MEVVRACYVEVGMPAWGSDTALQRYEVPAETRSATGRDLGVTAFRPPRFQDRQRPE